MKQIKEKMFDELTMKIVNVILLLVLIFKSSILGFVGSILCVLYLVQSVKTTNSGGWKTLYFITCIIALLLVFLNIVAFTGVLLG